MLFGKPESKRRCRLANRQALTDDAGGRKPYKESWLAYPKPSIGMMKKLQPYWEIVVGHARVLKEEYVSWQTISGSFAL